jgi:YesN/AraC family two-component response regulator
MDSEKGSFMKILIADDSADFRMRIRNLVLSHSKVQIVGECNNGVAAMILIQETSPDMIILDIRMPVMTGFQVLKKIKEQRIKTISCILTSYAYPAYRKRCLEEGADYFFNKSDDFIEINSVIERFLKTECEKYPVL